MTRHTGLAGAAAIAGFTASAGAEPPHQSLRLFGYPDVRLTGGPLEAQARVGREFFLSIPDDNLLHGFRTRAGLAAPGSPMGGWYDPQDFAGAHAFGQFVSAYSRYYASTRDDRHREKAASLVRGFRETFAPDGSFYASDKVQREWPCYLYDKNCTGMRDALTLAHVGQAREVLDAMTDWAVPSLARRSDEWYTLPAGLFRSHALTGEARYLTLASEFDHSAEYFGVFARGENAFRIDRHAYSHVNALSSATAAYESKGEAPYLDAAIRAHDRLVAEQSYASGGWGPEERFVAPGSGGLKKSLSTTHKHFETPCGTYATVNLCRDLIRFTGDAKYADTMERVLFNGQLACLPMKADGSTFYYSDYSPGARKAYFTSKWPCCAGTYALNAADLALNVFAYDDAGVVALLFTPAHVSTNIGGAAVTVEQATAFPDDDAVTLTVGCHAPVEMSLGVRRPAWAGEPEVFVNGERFDIAQASGGHGFIRVTRLWSGGDTLRVRLPMPLRFRALAPESPEMRALMLGPIMLVALAEGNVTCSDDPAAPSLWLKAAPGAPLTFESERGALRFVPFFRVRDERYTTYLTFGERP